MKITTPDDLPRHAAADHSAWAEQASDSAMRSPASKAALLAVLQWPAVFMRKFSLPWLMAAIAFVIVTCAPGFTDPDFYWHLKTGELIAQSGAIPAVDPFSYTFAGKPWVTHEWLTELLFYWTAQAGGFTALRLLPALAAATAFMLLYATARRLAGNELVASLATACFFIAVIPSFTLRPQIFSFLCFATYLLVLVDFKYFRSTRLLWLLPTLMLVWVNLHGAFMLGIALLTAFIAAEWGNRWLFPVRHARSAPRLGLLCMVLLATIAATLLNPQGLRILLYPFETVAMEASKGMIAEWHSPDFHELLPRVSLVGIFAWFIATVYARRKPDLTELMLPLLLIVAGLSAWRHLPLMAMVLLIFFCAMARHVDPATVLARSFRWKRRTPSHTGKQVTRAQAGVVHLLALAGMVLIALAGGVKTQREGETSTYVAEGAARYLLANDIAGRMLNDYDLGGYLIYRLWPKQKVFIDGRADLYGDAFLKTYFTVDKAGEGWEKTLDGYGIDIIVFARNAPVVQLLIASGKFRQAYADAHHVVLLRELPRFKALLDHPVQR